MRSTDSHTSASSTSLSPGTASAPPSNGIMTLHQDGERYQRLPTGAHGLKGEEVDRDQPDRLRRAIIELIAERGYPAVRIADLTKLARVSRPTFYSLYEDKEQLTLEAYEDIAKRTSETSLAAYGVDGTP